METSHLTLSLPIGIPCACVCVCAGWGMMPCGARRCTEYESEKILFFLFSNMCVCVSQNKNSVITLKGNLFACGASPPHTHTHLNVSVYFMWL